MAAPYDVNLSRTDAESIAFTVSFLDQGEPFSVEGLSFEYTLDGCGECARLSNGSGITIADDGYSIGVAFPVERRLRAGTYSHGLRATDENDFTQQIFYGTMSVSCGGRF